MARSRRKKTKRNREIIRTAILKIVVLLIFIGLNWTGLLAVGKTFAYFFDNEDSNANNYTAGILDFSLSSSTDFSPSNLTPCQPVSRDISIVNHGNPIQYTIQATEFSGELCGYLNLIAKLDEVEEYSGLLTDFDYGSVNFSAPENWNFLVSLNNSNPELQNQNCQFKLIFEGWQTKLPDPSSGFSDREEIINNVTTGDWLPEVTVIYPNGGETWYVVPPAYVYPGFGRYDIKWSATSPVYNPEQLSIDIWFCNQSGANCFFQIADNTDNDGSYWWTIPYDSQFVGSDIRIKVIATDPCSLSGEDMSNTDYCPPLLTLEDLANFEKPEPLVEKNEETSNENIPEEPVCQNGANRPCGTEIGACQVGVQICEQGVWGKCIGSVMPSPEICDEVDNDCDGKIDEGSICSLSQLLGIDESPFIEEIATSTEETSTTTDSTENQEEGGIIEEINEIIDGIIDEIVEEIIPDEPADEEILTEDTLVIDETTTIEEASTTEESVIEEAPAIEEQPVIVGEPEESDGGDSDNTNNPEYNISE